MFPSTNRPISFGAGPSKLPDEILFIAQQEMFSYGVTGISILELNHRSEPYAHMITETQQLITELLQIPPNYKILFVDGGATGQFSAVPMNLMSKSGTADYVNTGFWSNFASIEAEKYGKINKITALREDGETGAVITDPRTWELDPSAAAYVHLCTNETVSGVQFPFVPDTKGVPLIADMCSDMFTRPIDVSKFGMIYASAHKVFGTAGVGLVVVRDDLLEYASPVTPRIFNWKLLAQANSALHTPPSFPIYIINKQMKWIKQNGGLGTMNENAKARSKLIYDVIDKSNGFYVNKVDKEYRSLNNIPFYIGSERGNERLQEMFLSGAERKGMVHLKGHSTVGGIRVSIYNSMKLENVKKLADFMTNFEEKNKSNQDK